MENTYKNIFKAIANSNSASELIVATNEILVNKILTSKEKSLLIGAMTLRTYQLTGKI